MYFSLDSKPADHKDLGKHAQAENFQKNARKVVDYICGYTKNIGESRTFPDIEAGYLVDVFPGKFLKYAYALTPTHRSILRERVGTRQ